MLDLRYRRRWQIAGFLLLAFTLLAAVLPELPFFSGFPRPNIRYSDKIVHLITFVVLSIWFAGQFRPRSYWRIAAGLLGFGLLIELLQLLVSYRLSEWQDLMADAGGILVGIVVALMGVGGWSLRVEHWLGTRHG